VVAAQRLAECAATLGEEQLEVVVDTAADPAGEDAARQSMERTLRWACRARGRFLALRDGPVPGVASQLKCRGQVIETTKKVTYEVILKERGYRPEPYVIADALMYADGKPIVEITNLCLRLTGTSREELSDLWKIAQTQAAKQATSLASAAAAPSWSHHFCEH